MRKSFDKVTSYKIKMAENNQAIKQEKDNNPETILEDITNEIAGQNDNKINPSDSATSNQIYDDKERELLDMVFTLENEKQTLIDESKNRIFQLKKDLEDSFIDNEKLKRRVTQLEQTLKQSAALCGGAPPKTKAEQEELLTRAKTLLFEKTKICKQQETHINTLKTQVDSIKEVLTVTKEMLNLRNTEMEHMQARLDTANLRAKSEKDKCNLFEKKLIISKNCFDDVKSEHMIQSKLFKQLKESYECKITSLTKALEKAQEKEKNNI